MDNRSLILNNIISNVIIIIAVLIMLVCAGLVEVNTLRL